MSILKFKCTAKSDLVLNTKSASEGNNQTLDFIPGNCFLGIVAHQLYEEKSDDVFDIVHSDKVHFGDAHPAISAASRSLRIPASYYHPKGVDMEDECIIHHCHDYSLDDNSVQMKQCRNGFYVFQDSNIQKVNVQKSFVLKSAYDRESRRSKDSKMFGYEFLPKDTLFLFDVDSSDDRYDEIVLRCLVGLHKLGRSRTAQFGLVDIEPVDSYFEPQSNEVHSGLTSIYADGRLIFLDQYGLPTFQPTIENLGLESGEIRWDLSQVRTFNYAPWNSKRQAFDTERCGLEKGSVIVVENAQGNIPRYIGNYTNEGFGKTIVNPDFLEPQTNTNGLVSFAFIKEDLSHSTETTIIPDGVNSTMLAFLNQEINKKRSEEYIFSEVQKFRKEHESLFRKASYASQWGTIRSLAMANPENLVNEIENYVSHGVKSVDWMGTPHTVLTVFINSMNERGILREALINLASEMEKASKK